MVAGGHGRFLREHLAVLLLVHVYLLHKGVCGIEPIMGLLDDRCTIKHDANAAPGRVEGRPILPSHR